MIDKWRFEQLMKIQPEVLILSNFDNEIYTYTGVVLCQDGVVEYKTREPNQGLHDLQL